MSEQSKTVKLLRSGRLTIPAEFRKKLQIDEKTLLQVVLVGQELRIRPVKVADAAHAGSAWARDLYELLAPVREEAETAGRTVEDVDADIDKAVAAVRRKQEMRHR